MSEYMILFINGKKVQRTDDEKNKRMAEFHIWMDKYSKNGHLKNGFPLRIQGKFFSMENGSMDVDETVHDDQGSIAGYFILEAENENQAVGIIKECPHISHGGKIELREIAPLPV